MLFVCPHGFPESTAPDEVDRELSSALASASASTGRLQNDCYDDIVVTILFSFAFNDYCKFSLYGCLDVLKGH